MNMRNKIIYALAFALMSITCCAQNIIIQQNNQNNNAQTKIVEQVVEVDKVSTKPSSPVCLMGYLYVFPEAIKSTTSDIEGVVEQLNQHFAYGSNKWRVANIGELKLVLSHFDKLPGIVDRPLIYVSSTLERKIQNNYGTYYYNKCVNKNSQVHIPGSLKNDDGSYDGSSEKGHFIIIRTE